MTKTRVAIYARVSTIDKGQSTENQVLQLRRWCKDAGHVVIREYVDRESGGKGTAGRAEFGALLCDASRRKFDLVLFWALDRFSREGLAQTVFYLRRLSSYGISFHSYAEPNLSTADDFTRDILLGVLAALAAHERKRLSDRTKAGLARARAQGKKLGRPSLPPELRKEVVARLACGHSMYAIAKSLKCSYGAVWSIANPTC